MAGFEDLIGAFPPSTPERVASLKKLFRGEATRPPSKWMYDRSETDSRVYQGDVLEPLDVIWLDETGAVERKALRAIILSNTCDIQPGNAPYIIVAPIFPFSTITGELTEGELTAVRENQKTEFLFLHADGELFEDSFCDLSLVCSLDTEYFATRLKSGEVRRRVRLTLLGRLFVLCKLSHHLFRQESLDAKRTLAT
jgi:hypothetical protein